MAERRKDEHSQAHFRYLPGMARRPKRPSIESLSDTCTLCRKLIHPSAIRRLDGESSRCPHCGGQYYKPRTSMGMTTPTKLTN